MSEHKVTYWRERCERAEYRLRTIVEGNRSFADEIHAHLKGEGERYLKMTTTRTPSTKGTTVGKLLVDDERPIPPIDDGYVPSVVHSILCNDIEPFDSTKGRRCTLGVGHSGDHVVERDGIRTTWTRGADGNVDKAVIEPAKLTMGDAMRIAERTTRTGPALRRATFKCVRGHDVGQWDNFCPECGVRVDALPVDVEPADEQSRGDLT